LPVSEIASLYRRNVSVILEMGSLLSFETRIPIVRPKAHTDIGSRILG